MLKGTLPAPVLSRNPELYVMSSGFNLLVHLQARRWGPSSDAGGAYARSGRGMDRRDPVSGYDNTPAESMTRLGEYGAAILAERGYAPAEIAALQAKGAI